MIVCQRNRTGYRF